MFIVIGRREMTVTTTDGFNMRVRPLFIHKNDAYIQLHDCDHFDDVTTVRMVVRKRWGHLKRMPRNVLLEEGIAVYLQTYHAKADISFDCYAFVNLVHKVKSHKVAYMYEFWDTKPLRRKPEVGDILFLGDFKDHLFKHAVIYLGLGLCISVYGGGGDVEVSTLADMKRELKARDVVIAQKKK